MEPEVSLIEKYLQTVEKWLTVTNIRCRGRKEIDLLAVDPRNGDKFHIESTILTKRKLNLKELNNLAERKFSDSRVTEKIIEYFGKCQYNKWLVVSPQDRNQQLDEYADKIGIKIRYIDQMVRAIIVNISKFGSRDHIVRTLEIVKLINEWKKKHPSVLLFERP